MAVISFGEGSSDAKWVVAGWAFRQLLADTIEQNPEDLELRRIFDRAEEVGFLRLESLDQGLASRLGAAMRETAERILSGNIGTGIVARFRDDMATQEYMKGLELLVRASDVSIREFPASVRDKSDVDL